METPSYTSVVIHAAAIEVSKERIYDPLLQRKLFTADTYETYHLTAT